MINASVKNNGFIYQKKKRLKPAGITIDQGRIEGAGAFTPKVLVEGYKITK